MDVAETAAALRDAQGYEEALTERTSGMTNMVWGLAAALIFLTYGSAADLIERADKTWLYGVLWIPGVLLGTLLTIALWSSHAISLARTMDAKDGWRHLGLNIVAFLALTAALAGLLHVLDVAWEPSVLMTLVNGIFALIIATRERSISLACSRDTLIAGIWMIGAGIAIGLLGLQHEAAALAGAAITATGWAGSGLWTFLRS